MKKNILAGLLIALCACAHRLPTPPSTVAEPFALTILHVNDMHSHFDPARIASLPTFPDTLFGGYPAVLAYAKAVRAEQTNSLFLHAGDDFQGTGYFVLNYGRANAALLNRMGFDAMTFGNHEFDELREMQITLSADGTTAEQIVPGKKIPRGKNLAEFLDLVNFPVVAANVRVDNDPLLSGKTNLLPWVVKQVGGEKIGIIGLALETMSTISSPSPDVEFLPAVESARQAVRELEGQGVNKIILLTHSGYLGDCELARQIEGADVVVGGHSHDLLGDFSALGMYEAGPYPTVVTRPDGSRTLVVQAGANAKAVGRLNVTFDGEGRVADWSGGTKLLAIASTLPARKLPPDAAPLIERVKENMALRKIINRDYKPDLDRVYGTPIARVPYPLMHERTPTDSAGHGSQVAPLAAEGICWFMNEKGIPTDASFVNAGGIRTSIEAGQYCQNQTLLEVIIFGNNVASFTLTGRQIREVLESVVTSALSSSDYDGRFPYTGRLAYTYDPSRPDGQRITALRLLGPDGSWSDVADDQVCRMAASSYITEGNDGYALLKTFIDENGGSQAHADIIDNQVFTEYVKYLASEGRELVALPYTPVTILRP